MKKFITLLIIITLQAVSIAGDFSKVGTTSAQFLKIGVGARAMGLGGSFTALANDVSTLYWNPAGITNLRGFSFAVLILNGLRTSLTTLRVLFTL